MTVKDLIKLLSEYPQNMEVYIPEVRLTSITRKLEPCDIDTDPEETALVIGQ